VPAAPHADPHPARGALELETSSARARGRRRPSAAGGTLVSVPLRNG
jgi:hypothetical protein